MDQGRKHKEVVFKRIRNRHPILQAVQLFTKEADKAKLEGLQKLFVYERVCKYLKQSEFDYDHTPIIELLNSQKKKLKDDQGSRGRVKGSFNNTVLNSLQSNC